MSLTNYVSIGFLWFSHSGMFHSAVPGLQHARLPCPTSSPRVCLLTWFLKIPQKTAGKCSIELTVEQWAALHSPSFVQEMRKYPVFAYVSQKINESNFSNKKQISYLPLLTIYWAPLVVQMVKNLLAMQETTCNTAGLGSVPYSGRSPGGGHGYPLQYSCLENSVDRGAWRPIVHGVTKSQTRLSN